MKNLLDMIMKHLKFFQHFHDSEKFYKKSLFLMIELEVRNFSHKCPRTIKIVELIKKRLSIYQIIGKFVIDNDYMLWL